MTNRELAALIVIGAVVLFALVNKGIRPAMLNALRVMVSPGILVPLLGFAGWISFIIWVAHRYGFWTSELTGNTLLWFLTVGMAWFISLNDAAKDEDFFKRRMIEALGLAAFFEFFVNLESLPLVWELLLQAFLIVVVTLNAFSKTDTSYRPVAKLTSGIIGFFSLALILYTAYRVHAEWDTLRLHDVVNELLLPIWLTAAALIALYPLAVYAGWEYLLTRLRLANRPQAPPLKPILGAALELKFSLVDINGLGGKDLQRVLASESFADGRQTVRDFKRVRSDKLAAEATARDRLVRYAGVEGVDSDGLIRDRREFAATKAALDWLATCHMGWYQRDDQPNTYRADLLTILGEFNTQGLSGDPGISMKVRKDGQAWYAHRRTPSGHVFGIGANGAPPSRWFYDGSKPPNHYPSKSQGWTHFMDRDRPEWKTEPPTGT